MIIFFTQLKITKSGFDPFLVITSISAGIVVLCTWLSVQQTLEHLAQIMCACFCADVVRHCYVTMWIKFSSLILKIDLQCVQRCHIFRYNGGQDSWCVYLTSLKYLNKGLLIFLQKKLFKLYFFKLLSKLVLKVAKRWYRQTWWI